MLGLAECHKARALVIGDVQVVAVEVHAVAPLLRVRAVDTIVRLVLSVAEGARIPETGMRSGLQRPEPCLSSYIQAAPCMVLAATDQGEGFSRLAVVGGNKAPSSKYPARQCIILGFAYGLQRQLVPRARPFTVTKVERRPAAKSGQMPSYRTQTPPLPDRLRVLKEARDGA